MTEAATAQLTLINELLELTKNRNCYAEIRLFLHSKKYELENEDET